MAEKKKHLIKVQDQLVPVNEEVYLTYYRNPRIFAGLPCLALRNATPRHSLRYIVCTVIATIP